MRSAELRIKEEFHLIPKRNPISGHEWNEHGPTTTWCVTGPTGTLSRHRTLEGAEKELAHWKAYYDRGGWEEHPMWDYKNNKPMGT